jgi:hypothetical protein
MAKQGKQDTVSSVSDILGFILEQSELPPEKRTPVRPPEKSEVQSESEYVGSLVDALAYPGTFIGDEILGTVKDLVDPAAKIQTSQDRIGNVKIKASDLPAFFENPDEFVDKVFAGRKEISKMSRLQWAGEQMKMLAGSTYAKKMELFDNYSPEMKAVMERAVGQSATGSQQPSDITWVTQASEKIMKNGHLGKRYTEIQNQLSSNQITPAEKRKLEGELGDIEKTYKNSMEFGKSPAGAVNGFRSLLGKELEAKKNEILKGRSVDDLNEQEFSEYTKAMEASNMVNLWNEYPKKDIKADLIQKKNSLIQHKNAIEQGSTYTIHGKQIDYSQLSEDEKKKHLEQVRKEIRGLRSARNSVQRMNFWTGVGTVEGTYYGVKNTLGPGTIEAMLNGKFYDPKNNYYGRPSYKEKKAFGGAEIEFVKAENLNSNGTPKGKMAQSYNDAMVGLYYLNPATGMKSLVTGEVFAWLADRKLNKLNGMVDGMWSVKSGDFMSLKDRQFWEFWNKYKGLDDTGKAELLALDKYGKYNKLVSRINNGLKNPDSAFAKKFLKAQEMSEKMMKQYERLSKYAKFFNTPTRLLNTFQEKTVGKFQEKVRERVVGMLKKLKIFSGNDGAMALLDSWLAGAGGKALGSAISTAVVSALGLAGTALGGPLGTAISLAVSAALEKVTKLSIKVFIFAFAGVFFLFVLVIGSIGTHKKQSRVDAYSREYPGSIYYNEFESYGGSTFDDDDDGSGEDDGPEIIPPVTDEECILGTGYKSCTQGWGGVPCFSHASILGLKPVDLTNISFIHAPQFCDSPGAECVVQNSAPFYCRGGVPGGGQVWFSAFDGKTTYKFHYVHTILVNGFSPGSKVPAGATFAYVQDGLTRNSCWSGRHLHMEVQQNGAYVDPLALLKAFNCDVPSLSGCTNCVGSNTNVIQRYAQ